MKKQSFQLRNHPFLSIVIIILLLVITLIISEILIQTFKINTQMGRAGITFGAYAMLCFFMIPLLRLPRGKKSFSEYLFDIRLTFDKNIFYIVFISIICYLIFAGLQLAGSLIYFSFHPGQFVFDPDNHSFLQSGSLNAGIYEEIIFRGVILTLLLDRLSENKSMLVSALAFGAIHLLNMLNPSHQGIVWIGAQVIWAFALGVMYAYLVIRINSILPAIILHYFINAFTGVWLTIPQGETAVLILYHLAFFGILPAAIVVIWVRYLVKQGKFIKFQTAKNSITE